MDEKNLIDYLEAVATAYAGVAHTPEAKRFALGDEVWDVLNSRMDASALMMVLRNEEAEAKAIGGKNLVEAHQCGIWLVRKCQPGDHTAVRLAYREALQAARDILSLMRKDKAQSHALMQYLELQSVHFRKEGPIFGELEKEAEALFRRWLKETEEGLLYELRRQKVEDTRKLRQTLRTRLAREGKMLRGEVLFLDRGRFVDMGVGRGQKISQLSKRRKSQRSRNPKPWYSRAAYGRLNTLAGALGIEFSEQIMKSISDTIKE